MANVLGELFQDIADAIRSKTGGLEAMAPASFPEEISAIKTNGFAEGVHYVTFMSQDGTAELYKRPVADGDDCADPVTRGYISAPTKASTAQYNYSHVGWAAAPNGAWDENALKAVTGDKTVYAAFASALRYYTITFYDSDGTTVLTTKSVGYGSTPSYTPTKTGYQFDGWTPTLTAVTGDASYTANWSEISLTLNGTFASGATWKLVVTGPTASMTLSGSGAMDNYTGQSQQPWAEHRDKINSLSIGSNITTIGNYAFDSCKNLTKVTIPSKVTKIGDYAFQNCIGITQITLNEGLKTIGNRAFYSFGVSWADEKYPLDSITIPASVTQIYGGAFKGFSIPSATFKDTVGWKVHASSMTASSGWVTLAEENLANAATAAHYLDKSYTNYYWKKV